MDTIVNPPVLPPAPPSSAPAPMASVPSVTPAERIVFSGRRPDFSQMVIRGGLLEFVTLGFYRFWLATDMRRHLWSHSSVEGDALEYTGTAKELFIGFLFAMAIFVPIYVVYFVLGLEAERVQAFASTPFGLFFYLFAQFAIYRARRYRVSRTIWRGVRFSMRGSGWNYAWRVAVWSILTSITFGLALPWRQAALERFKMRHTQYGNLAGRFDGRGWDFFKQGWWVWLLMWPSATLIIPLPFLYGVYKAMEWRWWASGLRFGGVRFGSDLSNSDLFDLYWKVLGWSFLLMVFLLVWTGVALGVPLWLSDINWSGTGRSQAAFTVLQQPSVLITIGLGYVMTMLSLVVVLRIYLVHDVWERIADSMQAYNLAAAANVTAQGELATALGEGFADSLDVAGF
jgi:uncharacterized membrane protein YjgN (DUF898 family)